MNKNFRDSFNFKNKNFSDPTDFPGEQIGFSVKKQMQPDGYASMFKFYVKEKDLEIESKYKPVIISVNYGKIDEDGGIILSSSDIKRNSLVGPLDLISVDEYFYDPQENKFFNKQKEEVSADSILDKMYRLHTKLSRPISSLWLRIKLLFWHNLLSGTVQYAHYIFVFLLYIISGTKIAKGSIYLGALRPDQIEEELNTKNKVQFEEKKKIEIAGYNAPFWSIVFYATFHLFLYILFYFINFEPKIIKLLLKYNFLTLIYIITSLSFVEIAMPKLLKFLIIKTSAAYFYFSIKRIKI